MTFIEFKKMLLDAEISLPKFCKLIKVSDKNLQSYKKKGDVPNTIAVIVTCFARMHRDKIDYRDMIDNLHLRKQTKTGGFKKKSMKADTQEKETSSNHDKGDDNSKDQKKQKRKKENSK